MIGFGLQELAQIGAERVLNAIPGGLLIAAFACLLIRIAGKQNSGTRFAVWFSALLEVAALPFMPVLAQSGMMKQAVRPEIVLPAAWGLAIFSVWILTAGAALIRIVAGLWKLSGLRRSSVVMTPSDFHPALRDLI